MNEEDLNKFIAKHQNTLDSLTRKIYGHGVKFESLSPFGQNTIESLARERHLISDPDPELRHSKMEAATLRHENAELQQKLTSALNENQDLWEDNEELRLQLYEAESNPVRSQGRRKE